MSNKISIGLVVGVLFTGVVVGLLLWLNFGVTAEVPPLFTRPVEPRQLVVCAGAPEQAREFLGQARNLMAEHKCLFDEPLNGFCNDLCRVGEGDRMVPCRAGAVLISLRDGEFDEDHAGETVWSLDDKGQVLWATVLLPEKILAPETSTLPVDAYALTVAHELGHACGFGHTKTHVIGPLYAEKTGELMNQSLLKTGWGVEGLP